MKPIALDKVVFVGEEDLTNALHTLVWAADIGTLEPPDVYCNWCHKKWHRQAYKAGREPKWLGLPCSARSSESASPGTSYSCQPGTLQPAPAETQRLESPGAFCYMLRRP